jgi:hypothetical protein
MIDQKTLQAIQDQFKQHLEDHPFGGDQQNITIVILKAAIQNFSNGELRHCLRESGALDVVKEDMKEWAEFFARRES